jgi:hypothetical protein
MREQTLSVIFLLIVSFLGGIIVKTYILKPEINISYISQAELLDLEKSRLKGEVLNNRQLFFGKPEEAIKLIEEIQTQKSKDNNIVLLSQNSIYGKSVKSISKEVYEQLIERLK